MVSADGTGTLITQADATFGFDTSGQITQVNVKVGDHVAAGQVLAQLDNTLAQIKYNEAQQALQELQSAATIATIQKEIATAQDTEFGAHEWLKYLLSPEVVQAEEDLAAAQQRLTDAQTAAQNNPSTEASQLVKVREQAVTYLQDKLTQAQKYYEDVYLPETFGVYINIGTRRFPKMVLDTYVDPHTGELVPKINSPSPVDITTARNNLSQAQQTIKDGQTYLEVLKTGVIPKGVTGSHLNDLYNTQQALNNAQAALDATQLIAPISGTITALDLNIGEQAGTSSVVTISELAQPYTVDAYLDETGWNMAKVGNKVNVTFSLLPDKSFMGTVALVYPELVSSFNSNLVHILVKLDQSISQDLPAGTKATVTVIGGEANRVLLVPIGALHKSSDGTYFVNVFQNGQKIQQKVDVGLRNDSFAEIKSGLSTGEFVATQ